MWLLLPLAEVSPAEPREKRRKERTRGKKKKKFGWCVFFGSFPLFEAGEAVLSARLRVSAAKTMRGCCCWRVRREGDLLCLLALLLGFWLPACRTRLYTNHWAVRISGGLPEANRIASKYGYINIGQVKRNPLATDMSVTRSRRATDYFACRWEGGSARASGHAAKRWGLGWAVAAAAGRFHPPPGRLSPSSSGEHAP